MDIVKEWFERKLKGQWFRLDKPTEIVREFKKLAAGHIKYGKLTLSATPADEFSFHFDACCDEIRALDDRIEPHILAGVLDVAFGSLHLPVLGVAFTVKNMEYHPVDSVPIAYYFCAREATKEILGVDAARSNTLYPHEHLTGGKNKVSEEHQ